MTGDERENYPDGSVGRYVREQWGTARPTASRSRFRRSGPVREREPDDPAVDGIVDDGGDTAAPPAGPPSGAAPESDPDPAVRAPGAAPDAAPAEDGRRPRRELGAFDELDEFDDDAVLDDDLYDAWSGNTATDTGQHLARPAARDRMAGGDTGADVDPEALHRPTAAPAPRSAPQVEQPSGGGEPGDPARGRHVAAPEPRADPGDGHGGPRERPYLGRGPAWQPEPVMPRPAPESAAAPSAPAEPVRPPVQSPPSTTTPPGLPVTGARSAPRHAARPQPDPEPAPQAPPPVPRGREARSSAPQAAMPAGAPAPRREPPPLPAPSPSPRPTSGSRPRPEPDDQVPGTDLSSARLLRPSRRPPQSGWRRLVYVLSGRLINPGESPLDVKRRELTTRVNAPLLGCYKIAMLSLKGGVGKTTVTATLGSTFASLRGDRVVAVDANPDRGTLSQKIPLETSATVRNLLRDAQRVRRYTDVRAYTSQSPSRLEVLASEQDPAVSEAFSRDDYRRAVNLLEHFYNIVLTDCGTGLMHSAMEGVLNSADQLIIVSSSSIDGARSASATMDWLDAHGHEELVRRSVAVINNVSRSSGGVDLDRVAEHFAARCRGVVRVPFDAHLQEGAEVDLDRLEQHTRIALLELAALVADEFGSAYRSSR